MGIELLYKQLNNVLLKASELLVNPLSFSNQTRTSDMTFFSNATAPLQYWHHHHEPTLQRTHLVYVT